MRRDGERAGRRPCDQGRGQLGHDHDDHGFVEISASIASSGYTGVVQGTFLEDGTEILRMNYLLTDAIVKNNDQVVTTGSTLYPRGLLLGYITNASLDETGVAKYATLEPSCDLGKLEQIAIITQYDLQ